MSDSEMAVILHPVVVLFVRADSLYKAMPGVECYDAQRNALTWGGGCPVVAHPRIRAREAVFTRKGVTRGERGESPKVPIAPRFTKERRPVP